MRRYLNYRYVCARDPRSICMLDSNYFTSYDGDYHEALSTSRRFGFREKQLLVFRSTRTRFSQTYPLGPFLTLSLRYARRSTLRTTSGNYFDHARIKTAPFGLLGVKFAKRAGRLIDVVLRVSRKC